jgi:hypothetical protein
MPGCTIYAISTPATLLLAGVPVHVVAARLGHADPAVTLRVYSPTCCVHAASVGDILRPGPQRLVLANPLASDGARDDQQQRLCFSQEVVRGVEPPTFRFSGVADGQVRGLPPVRGRLPRYACGRGWLGSLPSVLPSELDDLNVGHGVVIRVLRHDRDLVGDRGGCDPTVVDRHLPA